MCFQWETSLMICVSKYHANCCWSQGSLDTKLTFLSVESRGQEYAALTYPHPTWWHICSGVGSGDRRTKHSWNMTSGVTKVISNISSSPGLFVAFAGGKCPWVNGVTNNLVPIKPYDHTWITKFSKSCKNAYSENTSIWSSLSSSSSSITATTIIISSSESSSSSEKTQLPCHHYHHYYQHYDYQLPPSSSLLLITTTTIFIATITINHNNHHHHH